MEQSDTESATKDATTAEERLKKKLEAVSPDSKPAEGSAVSTQPAHTEGSEGSARGDVSAATLARMMGLATATEVSLLEGKIDLLSTRVNSVAVRMDKILSAIEKLPNANDVDRIDINIGSLKTMIRDTIDKLGSLSEMESDGDKNLENVTIMTSGAFETPEEEDE